MEYKTPARKCRVIGVMSFKGGVGKTSCTANLACALAKLNKRVLAVDSNFSSPNLALNFGLINPSSTLREVLANKARIEDAIHIHDSNVHIIPCAPVQDKIDVNKFTDSINKLRDAYEFVLLDCSPSLNHELIASLTASDELIIVSTSDYSSLISSVWAAKIAKEKNIDVIGIILNRTKGKKFELGKKDMEEATGLPVIATLPEDDKAIESASRLMPLFIHSPSRKISNKYREIASFISGEEYINETFWGKIKSFIPGYNKEDSSVKVKVERFY